MSAKRTDSSSPDPGGRCLACQTHAPKLFRGLCQRDYERFRRQRDKLPLDKQAAFEARLIGNGLLLVSRQGQQASHNVFAEELAEFLADDASGLADEAEGVMRHRSHSRDATPVEDKPPPKKRRKLG
jgi:hypothetical protein